MIIGITGGIGSGKSYVCHLMKAYLQLACYDCDSEAKRLMHSSSLLRKQLQEVVGPQAYDSDGRLDKSVVSRYLFADTSHAERINAIVHPAVKADFQTWAERQTTDVLMESAILVEAGFRKLVDCLIVVDAPMELRIQRAMQRDGCSREQVMARIQQQMPQHLLNAEADLIINNDGRDLQPQIQQVARLIENIHQKNEYTC